MKNNFLTTLFLLITLAGKSQQFITEQAVLDSAMKYSPALKSAELQIVQNKYLQKTAFNISNLDVIAESPTGTFYPIGALQTLDFPTVYFKQSQLQKQVTVLSEKEKVITQQDVKRLIHQLYISLQYAWALQSQLKFKIVFINR